MKYSGNNTRRTLMLNAVIGGALLSGTVFAQVAQRAELEPVKIELGEGRFQLPLDPAVGVEPPAWLGGAIEWEYAGQATYVTQKDRAQVPGRKRDRRARTDDGVTDTLTRLLRTEMEDEHGRRFRVKSIDPQVLQDVIDQYDQRVAEEFGLECAECVSDDGSADDPEPTLAGSFTPLGWNRIDQDGDGDDDLFRYNSDGRALVSEPLTVRQEKAVIYYLGDINIDAGSCTGVLVDDYYVLTAAHCAKNDAGTAWIYADDTNAFDGQVEARRGKVCTEGNYYSGADCANVTARWGNGSWGGNGDMGDDIVVLKIDEPLGAGNYMAMSQASNSTLKSHDNFNLGHPGLTPTGVSNIFSCGTLNTGDPFGGYEDDAFAPCESKMYWDADDVTYTSSKVIGTRIDMSAGHSGGPIFYYPGGVSPTASHYLTGIVSGHHNGLFEDYNGGPKIKYHRDWVLGIID